MLIEGVERKRRGLSILLGVVVFFDAAALRTEGVIFYATGDPEHNATPPTGSLLNSGWDLQGQWGVFLGTPIHPHAFLTASHVGGQIGDVFVFRGQNYHTTASFKDPDTDLIVWQVSETFPSFAQLYTSRDETGKNAVVFGRGTQRGDLLEVAGLLGTSPRGWKWGAADGRMRWGENTVSTTSAGGIPPLGGGLVTPAGLLRFPFDPSGGPNEAHLSVGDSGGGVFIQEGVDWKLAGINYAVDGPFNTEPSGPGFGAALYDKRDLYQGGEGHWQKGPPSVSPDPSAFYATRISDRIAWIQSVLPGTSGSGFALQSAPAVDGLFTDLTDAAVDTTSQTITLNPPNGTRFYRLTDTVSREITSVSINQGHVVIAYQ